MNNETQKKPITKSTYRSDFKIYQLVKLSGIRNSGKPKSNMSRFISPIYGSNVPDDVIIPNRGEGLGDNTKRLDVFRVEPKLKDEYDNYSEFNIINNNSRKEFLGGKIVDDSTPTENDNTTFVEPQIKPIVQNDTTTPNVTYAKSSDFVFNDAKPKVVEMEPVVNNDDLEPKIAIHEHSNNNHVVSSNFGDDFSDFETNKNEVSSKPVEHKIKVRNKSKYIKPPITMFKKITRDKESKPAWLLEQIEIINETLKDFNIEGEVIGSTKGPTVTRYEIALQPGVNVNRISNLSDNLMMSLQAKSLRIEAPIPGKPYVGLEVPNVTPEVVAFGNVVDDPKFYQSHDKPLLVALGVDIDGENVYVDIAKMPHGLIAGATNSGKSVCINTVLSSLLIKNSPEELKLILIDPKMVELNAYNELPHLVTPVITDAKMASQALKWAVDEMEKRYRLFAGNRSKDIKSFNENIERGIVDLEKMPYLVIVIDELADLMMAAASDVEDAIQRLTQKARAAGVHLIVATQRPTTDVVKGTIKSNIPVRIAFKVASFVDSTTIIDSSGAENLLGKGDMLLKEIDAPIRLQGAYIPDDEIYKLTDYIRGMEEPNYLLNHDDLKARAIFKPVEKDDLFNDVAIFVVSENVASINRITQEFNISFNRAQAIMTMLEKYEIVSPSQGTKARDIYVNIEELEEILNNDVN